MVKKKARPLQMVVRVGDKIDFPMSIKDYGDDARGRYCVIEREEGVADIAYITAIGDDDSITLSDLPFDFLFDDDFPPQEYQESEQPEITEPTAREETGYTKETKQAKKEQPKENQFAVVTETLNIRLTKEERDAAAKNTANLLGILEDEEANFKNIKTSKAAIIKTLKELISKAKASHNTGLEYRPVTCEQHFDRENLSTWFVYRGETYGMRAMNEREERETKSRSLFGDAPVLPNRVEQNNEAVTGDELAKEASAVETKKAAKKKASDDKQNENVRAFKAKKTDDEQSKDEQIRDVMNSEKKKGGKHDHVST